METAAQGSRVGSETRADDAFTLRGLSFSSALENPPKRLSTCHENAPWGLLFK